MTKLEQLWSFYPEIFNNAEQYQRMQEENKPFPYAEHAYQPATINPNPSEDFPCVMVEETYINPTDTPRLPSPVLLQKSADGIRLTSYEIPEGCGTIPYL